MSSVSDKIFLFIVGWCSQCFIHPLLMMTQHELLFVHFFNDCSYLYKFTHMLLLWTIYTFFNIEMCVCVSVHTVICMCVYQIHLYNVNQMNWYIYIVCTYLFIQQFLLVLESDWLREVRYSCEMGTPTASPFASLHLWYFSQGVSWQTPKFIMIL